MDLDPQPDSDRLQRLNTTEREILSLFASGHTAKSIAVLKGVSVGAVNERLRAARRKTGAVSSRELARLLAAQENRDELIGLAAAPLPTSASSGSDLRPLRRGSLFRHWRVGMTALVLVAAAVLAQQTATPVAPQSGGVAASIVSQTDHRPDAPALHAAASGDRDPDWSPAAEAALNRRYGDVRNASRLVKTLTVRCSRHVCEVEGVLNRGSAFNELDELNGALQSLGQRHPVNGLDQITHAFTLSDTAPPGFLSYWRRQD